MATRLGVGLQGSLSTSYVCPHTNINIKRFIVMVASLKKEHPLEQCNLHA